MPFEEAKKDNPSMIVQNETGGPSRVDDIEDSIPTIIGKLPKHLQAPLSSLELKFVDTWEGFEDVNPFDLLVNVVQLHNQTSCALNIFFNKAHTKLSFQEKSGSKYEEMKEELAKFRECLSMANRVAQDA
ncbi:hypothetical protein Pint_31435 [Pistacia integerrima]|uniref:Uncharacterized protein n=1 Tax=Pistacia integerrima TaxID=434235 RepID=A0ACC0XQ45_9ROSI|nr:hypothetical protein Pint_31435 [Pistacia integerrima]